MPAFKSQRWRAFFFLFTIVVLALGGCSPQWSAGFPEVPLQKPAGGAMKIGVAQVEDSRPSYAVGWVGGAQLLAGPDLPDFIERQFRNGLTERGFDPIAALDPARTSVAQPFKVLVVNLQSAEINSSGWLLETATSETWINVRVFSRTGTMVFNRQFSGHSAETAYNIDGGVVAGGLMAPAINNSVSAAFADRHFLEAVR